MLAGSFVLFDGFAQKVYFLEQRLFQNNGFDILSIHLAWKFFHGANSQVSISISSGHIEGHLEGLLYGFGLCLSG